MSFQISYVETLTPSTRNVTILYLEIGPLSYNKALGWNLIQSDCCPHKRRQFEYIEYTQDAPAEERPCEHIAGRWPSASQRKRPQEKPNLPTPSTPSLQN